MLTAQRDSNDAPDAGLATKQHEQTQSIGAGGIVVDHLYKTFVRTGGTKVNAVDDVSLTVAQGEIVVLLGPSGCGKTTLLRCIAGLEEPSGGKITISNQVVFSKDPRSHVPTERRRLSMMFQSYAIWPHMTVRKNVAYPLRSRRIQKSEIAPRVDSVLERVGISELADQYPGQLSGGQQQRVALARSLVVDPEVVLFDEPLSNVDAKVREQLRIELLTMQRKLRFAAVYVTHDQEEAMHMADRLAVMREGRIVQLGTSDDVYRQPVSQYVAGFVGRVNQWEATRVGADSGPTRTFTTAIGDVEVSINERSIPNWEGGVMLLTRPEDVRIRLMENQPPASNQFTATVISANFLGSHTEYVVDANGVLMRVWAPDRNTLPEGSKVCIELDPSAIMVLARDAAL